MDVEYLLEYLDYTADIGVTLSTEQLSIVQNSLRILQDQASLNGLNWVLIPNPVSQDNAYSLSQDCRVRFVGDPLLFRDVEEVDTKGMFTIGERGEGDVEAESIKEMVPEIEQNENTERGDRSLKEEDRLAAVVHAITVEAFVLPRRALFKVPDKIGSVVYNKYFQGLNDREATRLQNFVHYREPRNKWNTNLVQTSAANYSTDFLDSVDEDIPKNKSWCLVQSYDQMIVLSKSLYWPGSVFFHVLDTPRYGNCYFGFGIKNYDLPFMLSSVLS
ncbi:hypothetical protein M8J76_011725 [Diaphorina citri]|nr:hypothetical protein M8J76_011725 [Diaphorina citri]